MIGFAKCASHQRWWFRSDECGSASCEEDSLTGVDLAFKVKDVPDLAFFETELKSRVLALLRAMHCFSRNYTIFYTKGFRLSYVLPAQVTEYPGWGIALKAILR